MHVEGEALFPRCCYFLYPKAQGSLRKDVGQTAGGKQSPFSQYMPCHSLLMSPFEKVTVKANKGHQPCYSSCVSSPTQSGCHDQTCPPEQHSQAVREFLELKRPWRSPDRLLPSQLGQNCPMKGEWFAQESAGRQLFLNVTSKE